MSIENKSKKSTVVIPQDVLERWDNMKSTVRTQGIDLNDIEMELIRRYYGVKCGRSIAKELNISEPTLRRIAHKMGLTK